MSARPETVVPGDGWTAHALAAPRALIASLMGGGPLDRFLLVRAPDLWLLRPATSLLWGILGVPAVLACPVPTAARTDALPWMILAYLGILSLFATTVRVRLFGERVSFLRPRYVRYRPLLIASLPICALLPGYLCLVMLRRPDPAAGDPIGYHPATMFALACTLAAVFASSVELDLRFGRLFKPGELLRCVLVIVGFMLLNSLILASTILYLFPVLSSVGGAIILTHLLLALAVIVTAVFRLVALQKLALATAILLGPLAAGVVLFAQTHGAISAAAEAAIVGLAGPLIAFRVLERSIDRLAFQPHAKKDPDALLA
jgi:hypothetical protein